MVTALLLAALPVQACKPELWNHGLVQQWHAAVLPRQVTVRTEFDWAAVEADDTVIRDLGAFELLDGYGTLVSTVEPTRRDRLHAQYAVSLADIDVSAYLGLVGQDDLRDYLKLHPSDTPDATSPPIVHTLSAEVERVRRHRGCPGGYVRRHVAIVDLDIDPAPTPGWVVELYDPGSDRLDWVSGQTSGATTAHVQLGADRSGPACLELRIRDIADAVVHNETLPCASSGCTTTPEPRAVSSSLLLRGLSRR